MVKVYFEWDGSTQFVALFYTEELFMQCLPALEAEAKEQGAIVTESIIEDDGLIIIEQ